MPGFNVGSFGGGYQGASPSNTVETRRENRWVMQTLGRGDGVFSQTELLLLESASRPANNFEEVEMHHMNEMAKFAGKIKWNNTKLRWYDTEQDPDVSAGIYHWIETVTNITSMDAAHPRFYKRNASLRMLDGTGQPNEVWSLLGTWPKSCDWGDLNYSSSKICMIECEVAFDRAVRQFFDGTCPVPVAPQPIQPSCPVN